MNKFLIIILFVFLLIPAHSKTMFKAVGSRDENDIIELINNGFDVNVKNNDGDTPLHWAADNENLSIARLLIEKGANLDIRNKNGCTPLHLAANYCNMNLIEFLLEKGAKTDIKDVSSMTPLHVAINIEVVDNSNNHYRINKNACIRDKNNKIVIEHLKQSKKFQIEAVRKKLSLFMKYDANINAQDSDGHIPLHRAVIFDWRSVVEDLIRYGARANVIDNKGRTPLDFAKLLNRKDIEYVLTAFNLLT